MAGDDGEAASAASLAPRRRKARSPYVIGTVVLVLGLLATALVAWTTWSQYRDAEDRLLLVQTRQASDVILASIPSTQLPLTTAAQLAASTGGDARIIARYLSAYVGTSRGFSSVTVWKIEGHRLTTVLALGPTLGASAAERIAAAAPRTPLFTVVGQLHHGPPRLGYTTSEHSSKGTFVIYAERALPRDRHSRVGSNVAFSDLHYAIYLGSTTRNRVLLTSDFPGLYPTGATDHARIPFGSSTLTLVTAPTGSLVGDLPARRPWLIAAFGALLSLGAAVLAMRLAMRRRDAERDADQIAGLHEQLAERYHEQRTIALTLQRSLLPVRLPEVPGLEIAVRYLPGEQGVEVGGDWYSVVAIDEHHVGFVVGDVAGKGVRAASVMAALRYTVRTLLLEGHPPDEVLATCAAQTHDVVRGSIATVLVGVADLPARSVTLSSAGHLAPLRLTESEAAYVTVDQGIPIGAPGPVYRTTCVETPAGTTLLSFTDGLVERRGEHLDVGLERLARSARRAQGDLEEFVTHVCEDLTGPGVEDDVAILALRWLPEPSTTD